MLENNSRYHLTKNQAQPLYFHSKVMPVMKETLGGLIQRRMRDVGIPSKAELARRLGISSAYAGDLANDTGKTKDGVYMPSPDLTAKMVEVLEVSENKILNAIGYASESAVEKIPAPILDAIGRNDLTEQHTELIANFIDMLGKRRENETRERRQEYFPHKADLAQLGETKRQESEITVEIIGKIEPRRNGKRKTG